MTPEQQAEFQLARRAARLVGPGAVAQFAWQAAVPLQVRRWALAALTVVGAFAAVAIVSRLTERAVR